MKIRDCLFGQIRSPRTCYDIPSSLQSIITDQQVTTWDNATGMNPMYRVVPIGAVHKSYTDLLAQSQLSCFDDEHFVPTRTDFSDPDGAEVFMAKVIGQWWLIQDMMDLPDALDYDYTIFRQTDTRYMPNARSRLINHVFNRMDRVTRAAYGEDCKKPTFKKYLDNEVPVMASSSGYPQGSGWPAMPQFRSSCWIINRAGLRNIKDGFYRAIESEIEHYQTTIGFNCSHIHGQPAHLLAKVAIKNNVEIAGLKEEESFIKMYEPIVPKDYSSIDRIRK